MDRIKELLSRITELSDSELQELKDLILQEFDKSGTEENNSQERGSSDENDGEKKERRDRAEAMELSVLEELAEASAAVKTEQDRRATEYQRRQEYAARLNEFRNAATVDAARSQEDSGDNGGAVERNVAVDDPPATTADGGVTDNERPDHQIEVPENRRPRNETAKTTVIRAGSDLPGYPMGAELHNRDELADAMVKRIYAMRGIRGGDGDKLICASASLDGISDELRLRQNEAEENLRKVQAFCSPQAIVAAGGLAAPEEAKYDLYGVGVTDRPIRSSLPVFTTQRGGVRFMRPPTLNDLQGSVGIWTVQDDIDAVTDSNTRKPSFRVEAGPEIVVDTQAVTLILTFGNLTSRAYPELVARHNELGMIAQARTAEQQLLTQIGALSTQVTGREQVLGAAREVLMQVDQAAASYRNRHRTGLGPLRAIMPVWFLDMLRSDVAMQHPGDGTDVLAMTDAAIQAWFTSRNINITWSFDGETGQDYTAITNGGTPAGIADFPADVIWYLYAEGTFAFMDGGTLDLGLVRDSTLNSANDYQMFVETFENVVKFGNESLRVRSFLDPTGVGSADAAVTPTGFPA